MPKQTTTITILLASPTDVDAERQLVKDRVKQWNSSKSFYEDVAIQVVDYQDNVSPGLGNYPQEVINNQIGEDYDALIGIFWTRVGSPTPDYVSGTVEEIERALTSVSEGKNMEVSVFWKRANVPFDLIDSDQLASLTEFMNSLKPRLLYKDFASDNAFRDAVDLLLDRLAKKFSHTSPVKDQNAVAAIPQEVGSDTLAGRSLEVNSSGQSRDQEAEDDGLIEVGEKLQEASEGLIKFLEEMGDLLQQMAKRTDEASSEFEDLNNAGVTELSARKPIIKRVAAEITAFSAFVSENHSTFYGEMDQIALLSRRYIDLSGDFDVSEEEWNEVREMYVGMRLAVTGSSKSLQGFFESVVSLPRLSSDLNKAKKMFKGAMQGYIDDLRGFLESIEYIIEIIERQDK